MSGRPLEIQVVYDGSRTGGRRTEAISAARRAGSRTLVTFGTIGLFLSAAMYYGIWWQLNPFINITMLMRMPVIAPMPGSEGSSAGANLDLADVGQQIFRINPPEERKPAADPDPQLPSPGEPRWKGTTAAALIATTAYAWTTLAMVGCCALGLASGSMLSNAAGPRFRLVGVGLTAVSVLALAAGVAYVWINFKLGYNANQLRMGMGGIAAVCMAIGLAWPKPVRRLTRLASVTLILAGAASAAGLYLWQQSGAIEAEYATAWFLAAVFAVHSLWGWILLPVASRL